ncbi:winged helix-turn-helix domain-containing protein [Alteromonas sp. CYL-A6]|uniref:winged helix-turn-helix domain-containing protein n=1 Tax=Alteromonas nitratireducens TaxID=3390813 RepID=UPI0034A819D3
MTPIQKFNGLAYNQRTRELTTAINDEPSLLTKQSGELLMLFLQADDHTLTRDEIRAQLWGHAHISDDVVNHAVCRLRKVLHELDPAEHIYIETLPATGYRLHGCDTQLASPKYQQVQRWIVLASLFSLL